MLVIDRTYEFVKWFLGRLEKFPPSHRYGLGRRIEAKLYGIFEELIIRTVRLADMRLRR